MSAAASSKGKKGGAGDDRDDDAASSGPNNSTSDPRADALVKEAEKKLKSWSLFSSGNKYEDAIELFKKAAAMYKMNKNWQLAGDIYLRIAEISETQLKEAFDAAQNYEAAGKCYKNVNPKEGIRCLRLAVHMVMEGNRFSSAAKLWKDMGEMHEKEGQTGEAIEAYNKAADCYETEDYTTNASTCRLKVAQLSAEQEDYQAAVEIYEKVAKQCLDGGKNTFSVTGYLFKALICQFALSSRSHDADTVERMLERYKDMHPPLDGSREGKLIENLIQAFNESDLDAFTDYVYKYDEIIRLDNWTAAILLAIKRNLQAGGPELDLTGKAPAAASGQRDADDFT